MKLQELSAAEIGKLVNSKQISTEEVTKYFINQIEKGNKYLNAFVYTKFDEALKYSEYVQRKVNDRDFMPFAGVPFALKDFLPSKKGWTHSYGGVKCMISEDKYNSVFCDAMEQAGGIPIGKTNSPAFGFRGTCDNKLYGATRNPYNLAYNPGGSSGGSAAAVGGELIPIAEGGDAGGSIRIPASWCNCFGYKASIGTIPSVCRPDAWSATHPYCFNGAITKTVEDTAILLDYMGKFNARDPLSRQCEGHFTQYLNKDIKAMKIGYTYDFGIFPVDPEIIKLMDKALDKFKQLGAEIIPVSFNLNKSLEQYCDIWCRGISIDTAIQLYLMKQAGNDVIKDHHEDFPEEFIYWNNQAINSSVLDYYEFNKTRTELLDAFEDVFEKVDILVCPTSICGPVKNTDDLNTKGPQLVNGQRINSLIGFAETFLVNFVGNPAASVPMGFLQNNLPVGLQIIGKRFKDSDVLTVSASFERISPWRPYYKNIVDFA